MADAQGEAENFKFIEITNWDKYQTAKPGSPWIKDYVEKEGDLAYSKLTALQRYLFDGLCRLRGRFSRHIHNDPTYIAQALCMVRTDRPHVGHAVRILSAHGLLTLTNEQLNTQSREEESKSKDRGEKNLTVQVCDTNSSSTSLSNDTKTRPKTPEQAVVTDTPEAFAEIWQRLMPLNPFWSPEKKPSNWQKLLVKDFTEILAQWEPWQLHEILAFSQFGLKQAQYNHTTRALLGKGGTIAEERKNNCKRKKDGTWDKIFARYMSILAGEEPDEKDTSDTSESRIAHCAAVQGDDDDLLDGESEEDGGLRAGFTWVNEDAGRVECTSCDIYLHYEEIDEHLNTELHRENE